MTLVEIFSGWGWDATGEAHGLNALRDELNRDARWNAVRFAWTDTRRALTRLAHGDPDSAPVLIGHSFGGSAAVTVATEFGRPCDLYLIDPVPTRMIDRYFKSQIEIPMNVNRCRCYMRDTIIGPFSKTVKGTQPRVVNMTLAGTSHTSVVAVACAIIAGQMQ